MHQIKLKDLLDLDDHQKLADCLTHSTDDPITVIKFIGQFRNLFGPIKNVSPFFNLEVEANAKLDAEAEIALAEAEDRGLIEAKDRRVA